MSSRLVRAMHKLESFKKRVNLPSDRKITFFLVALVCYSIFCRLMPASVISTLCVLVVLGFVFFEFYLYVVAHAKIENKNHHTIEYSWGYVKEKTNHFDLKKFFEYIHIQDFNFYRTFLNLHKEKTILFIFIFIDLIVAFKNLSFFYSGIYFALSIFTKFVFVAYIHVNNIYRKIKVETKDDEETVLDVFYSEINGIASIFFVLFVFTFLLSKYIVEIFFGGAYAPSQSSLPFILLANMFLAVALVIYETAKKIDLKTTNSILKVYIPIFTVIFIFMTINYVDTVTYFIIGGSSILSIFLYNFVIKKPQYIADTYNHLF